METMTAVAPKTLMPSGVAGVAHVPASVTRTTVAAERMAASAIRAAAIADRAARTAERVMTPVAEATATADRATRSAEPVVCAADLGAQLAAALDAERRPDTARREPTPALPTPPTPPPWCRIRTDFRPPLADLLDPGTVVCAPGAPPAVVGARTLLV